MTDDKKPEELEDGDLGDVTGGGVKPRLTKIKGIRVNTPGIRPPDNGPKLRPGAGTLDPGGIKGIKGVKGRI